MKAAQKNFILRKLIPFILREKGNGFIMENWKRSYTKKSVIERGRLTEFDGVEHHVPACGTVACIGGSIQCLTNKRSRDKMAKILGLSKNQANGLFYHWELSDGFYTEGWPAKFRRLFAARQTPLGKAKVAVNLLKEVVKTNGDCLNPTETA